MIHTLKTIGHRTTFNNKQNPYRIVRKKKPGNQECNTIHTSKLTI